MRRLNWAAVNSAMLASLYFGVIEGINGAQNLAYFITWIAIPASFVAYNDEAKTAIQKNGRTVPRVVTVITFLMCISTFVWFDSIVTGIFLFVALLNTDWGYESEV